MAFTAAHTKCTLICDKYMWKNTQDEVAFHEGQPSQTVTSCIFGPVHKSLKRFDEPTSAPPIRSFPIRICTQKKKKTRRWKNDEAELLFRKIFSLSIYLFFLLVLAHLYVAETREIEKFRYSCMNACLVSSCLSLVLPSPPEVVNFTLKDSNFLLNLFFT